MTHTSTTAPAQLFDPELLYNILMGAIEPELCTDVFPTLDDVYKDETEEGRNVRMERYDVAVKNFKKLYNKIIELNSCIEKETSKIESIIISKTGYNVFQFLHTYINTNYTANEYKHGLKNNNLLVDISNLIKYYVKLKIISNVCISFLNRSKEFLLIEDINIYKSILLDLFKPFIEIFIDDYNHNNNYNNIINKLFTKNYLFCYLSKYLFKYEQLLFCKKIEDNEANNNNDILSLHQFLMGSGKSTVIIPYLVFINFMKNKKTIVLVPDNNKIKNEMTTNINKIMLLFNKQCNNKYIEYKEYKKYDDLLKNNTL